MYPKVLDNSKPVKTHYMSLFRQAYLDRVLSKLQELIDDHFGMYENEEWYDGTFLNEDCEETMGFVFVACQTFIVGTIADNFKLDTTTNLSSKEKQRAMKNDLLCRENWTNIELINAVANYYKHRDEGEPLNETKKILDSFGLLSEDFPINEAFKILTQDNRISTLANYLCDWRNHLFNSILIKEK